MLKTVITYYGGKQRLLKYILPNIPPHKVYCEPMIGGGAVFIAKPPSKVEIINDIDSMISIFYRVLQRDAEELLLRIEESLYDRNTHKFALFIRKFPHWYSDLDIAWAFFILSASGFSGMLDSFGCYTKGTKAQTFENKKLLFTKELQARFKGVQIENGDGHELIKRRDTPDSFFYVDPPYPGTVQGHYAGYSQDMFEELLIILSQLRGKFLLSSFPSVLLDRYIKTFGWYVIAIDQPKSASKNSDGSKKRKTELLVANYEIKNPHSNSRKNKRGDEAISS